MWLKHPDCNRAIEESWRGRVYGFPMFILASKLKRLKTVLKVWNVNVFGNVHQKVQAALNEVQTIQNCINDLGQDNDYLDQEVMAQRNLLNALNMEEEFWKEKVRVNWHNNGDRNTSFFHRVTKVRQVSKSLNLIKDIVGKDVCNSVKQFFNSGWILSNMNSNIVVLIPMETNAEKIEDYKPIALANFPFKIITKVIADRLASIAARIVSPEQRGFIKGISIQDCICIASEAINFIEHKTFCGNMAIKLDIRKAFDTLDWNFLQDTLKAVGFNMKFITWINTILHSAKLSININGKNIGFFNCKRGVRQGDPLSPILFYLAEEVLSRGITKLLEVGKIKSIAGPRNLLTPSHVLYADDVLIFCRRIKRDLLALKHLIIDYAQVPSQSMNTNKCKFYIANANASKIANLASYLGFNADSLPVKYLGVHVFKEKSRKSHMHGIADRIITKLAKWKGLTLSIMGRVELVKSVMQGMLIYSFHIYNWPSQLLKHLDSYIRNFIWSGDVKVKKLVRVAWYKICNHAKVGGLGLRSLKTINQAAMLKLAWDMLSSNQEWAGFFKKRFGKPKKYYKSSIWPGIKANLQLAISNSMWLIGDGREINFWNDNWLGRTLVDLLNIPPELHSSLLASVADFTANSNWIIPQELANKFPTIALQISHIFICNSKDRLVWQQSNDGQLSLKEAFNSISPASQDLNWCKKIWSTHVPPSRSFITWRLILDRLPTDENLKLKEVFTAAIIHSIYTIWHYRNKCRFEDKNILLNPAINKIKVATSLSGHSINSSANSCIHEFSVLRSLHVSINYKKAPCIKEIIWNPPPMGRVKINSDGNAHGTPGLAGGWTIFRDHNDHLLGGFSDFFDSQHALFA
ncbi:PREDICTED: uncharacterized protein LOC109342391 [Lupinus angustifolius]|uniref:uncharacterized protein LOC109342391 n=1 Tax=Lupinus angustifolius TaxID=3871 RepID=UPI00092F2AA8|nr:PREDICTED: uncharacterized protein LOC109342391 [Lupinus angustifolius]